MSDRKHNPRSNPREELADLLKIMHSITVVPITALRIAHEIAKDVESQKVITDEVWYAGVAKLLREALGIT
jgi:hypothetical protein